MELLNINWDGEEGLEGEGGRGRGVKGHAWAMYQFSVAVISFDRPRKTLKCLALPPCLFFFLFSYPLSHFGFVTFDISKDSTGSSFGLNLPPPTHLILPPTPHRFVFQSVEAPIGWSDRRFIFVLSSFMKSISELYWFLLLCLITQQPPLLRADRFVKLRLSIGDWFDCSWWICLRIGYE